MRRLIKFLEDRPVLMFFVSCSAAAFFFISMLYLGTRIVKAAWGAP